MIATRSASSEEYTTAVRETVRRGWPALFGQPGHKHLRQCGDQMLRNFLKGLTLRLRGA